MFQIRQLGNKYQVFFYWCFQSPQGTQVREEVLLTTDYMEEAARALSELNVRGILALQKVANEGGKAFYRTNLPKRNASIIHRHFQENESIPSLARRFHVSHTTIRGVIDDYRRTQANNHLFHYTGL